MECLQYCHAVSFTRLARALQVRSTVAERSSALCALPHSAPVVQVCQIIASPIARSGSYGCRPRTLHFLDEESAIEWRPCVTRKQLNCMSIGKPPMSRVIDEDDGLELSEGLRSSS